MGKTYRRELTSKEKVNYKKKNESKKKKPKFDNHRTRGYNNDYGTSLFQNEY